MPHSRIDEDDFDEGHDLPPRVRPAGPIGIAGLVVLTAVVVSAGVFWMVAERGPRFPMSTKSMSAPVPFPTTIRSIPDLVYHSGEPPLGSPLGRRSAALKPPLSSEPHAPRRCRVTTSPANRPPGRGEARSGPSWDLSC